MFLHPWMIGLGILAAALPVAIHWLTRPRPRRIPLSTIRFVQEAIAQRRARHRLRDFLILTLRTLAVLLLAGAIARPLLQQQFSTPQDDSAEAVRVVLLDVSQSMAAETKGVTAFERARSLAGSELEFRQGLRSNLILAAATPSAVFAQPSSNFASLRDALASAAVLPQRLQAQPALNQAAEMLASGGKPGARRELVIVSDFQRTNWASADFSTLPSDTVIRLASVAGEETPVNFSIERVAPAMRLEIGQETRLEVDVGNHSPAAANLRVQVRLGDAVHELSGNCPPHSVTTLSTNILPTTPGWQVGEAKILALSDSLPADNIRPCIFEVSEPPSFAIVTRQAEQLRPSSSYYIERALSPGELGQPAGKKRLFRLAPDQLDQASLAPADLIILDHPGRLSPDAITLLSSLLKRGKSMLIMASDNADAVNIKQMLAANPGFKLPVEFQPTSRRGQKLTLTVPGQNQNLFGIFGDALPGLLGPLQFSAALHSQRASSALDEEVLAAYSDSSAFLVIAGEESGSLAILNADLERSNLPASPLFVPLLGELTRRLLTRHSGAAELPSGEPATLSLPGNIENASELAISINPPAQESLGELTQEAFGIQWRTKAASPPGVVELKRAGQTLFGAATVIPASESDLRTMEASIFEERLAGGRDVRFVAYSNRLGDKQDRLWVWLALLCLACVLGEFLTLKVFRT